MTSLKNEAFSEEDLLSEIDELKERLAESEHTRGHTNGEVDAVLISTDSGEQVTRSREQTNHTAYSWNR